MEEYPFKMKTNKVPDRAYINLEFLRSSEARTIRILSEFLEPQRRFKKHGVKNTVVFFGSARIKEPTIARKNFREILLRTKKAEKITARLNKKLEDIKIDVKMSQYYEEAIHLSKLLTRWSKSLSENQQFAICSGGGPGIMEAANRGALLAGGRSIGLNITLPFEQGSNQHITSGLSFQFHYFFMRKFWFVYLAKALVIFPGGFGTLDELFEVLTLVQTKKVTKKVAIVIYGKEYWNEVINFNAMMKYKTISAKDLNLFKIVDSPEEAFTYLKRELVKNFAIKRNKS